MVWRYKTKHNPALCKGWVTIAAVVGVTLPWLWLRFSGWHGDPLAVSLLSGLSILAAAFLLSWAAEVAQVEIPASLALAVLALISILPEYAVDMYFTWMAGKDLHYAGYAAANMTGANRLLVGFGWSTVVLVSWLRVRRPSVAIEREQSTEMTFLALATIWAFSIPLRRQIGTIDFAVLFPLFAFYVWRASRAAHEEPELTGPPVVVSLLPRNWRRAVTAGLFLHAALVIVASAEPFSEGLVHTGKKLGIDEFLLVQWLAPLASEAPEFLVATLFALRGNPSLGLGALISSLVNQWTLLVAMMPLVFSISAGKVGGLPLDQRQVTEVFLTAAQSAFALMVILNFEMLTWEALGMMGLFLMQLFFPNPVVRSGFGFLYLGLMLVLILKDRSRLGNLWRLVRNQPRTE
ncbi:MAG: sodium:calcium antiporter [Armatimonadota bacterium]|nr:sodium:calcium antiporter [Armatimonadota bacterium]